MLDGSTQRPSLGPTEAVMQCPRCRSENRDAVKFCEDCGTRLTSSCLQCGAEITPGKRFCGSCGASVAIQPADRFAGPATYTPKHLAEKILTSPTRRRSRLSARPSWCSPVSRARGYTPKRRVGLLSASA
jgi:hypothetical protein